MEFIHICKTELKVLLGRQQVNINMDKTAAGELH
jgi:hypothetical protein